MDGGYDAPATASDGEIDWWLASVPAPPAPAATQHSAYEAPVVPATPFAPELTALIDETFGSHHFAIIKTTLSHALHSKGYIFLKDLVDIGSACRGHRSNPVGQLRGVDVCLIERLLQQLCQRTVNHKTWDRLSDFFVAALEKTIASTPSPLGDNAPASAPGSRPVCLTHLHRAIRLRATATKDAHEIAFWTAVHGTYFGSSEEPQLLLTRGDLITDALPCKVLCAWPGCAHKNPYNWHFPAKSICFNTLFDHLITSHFSEKRPASASDAQQAPGKRQRTITEMMRPKAQTPAGN